MQLENNPQNNDFQRLCEIAANHLGIGDQFNSIRICKTVQVELENVLDPTLQKAAAVKSFKGGTIKITVSSSAVIDKIRQKAHIIQANSNSKLGRPIVQKISLKLV